MLKNMLRIARVLFISLCFSVGIVYADCTADMTITDVLTRNGAIDAAGTLLANGSGCSCTKNNVAIFYLSSSTVSTTTDLQRIYSSLLAAQSTNTPVRVIAAGCTATYFSGSGTGLNAYGVQTLPQGAQ